MISMNLVLRFTVPMVVSTACVLQGDGGLGEAMAGETMAGAHSAVATYRLAQTSRFHAKQREIERKRSQAKLQMERQRKEHELRRTQLKQTIDRQHKETERRRQQIRNGNLARSRKPKAPPFDPTKAPDPKECFEAFVKTVRSARSLDEFISYLPLKEQKHLKAQPDPEPLPRGISPEARAWFEKKRPKTTEAELNYRKKIRAHAFTRYKILAKKFRHIKTVEIDGNEATLSVATRNTALFDGVPYEHSSATVELIGENKFWRVSRYNDSGVYFKARGD